MRRKIPKVSIVIGKVRMIKSGFITAFKIPKTITKINAVEKESMTMCGFNINDNP